MLEQIGFMDIGLAVWPSGGASTGAEGSTPSTTMRTSVSAARSIMKGRMCPSSGRSYSSAASAGNFRAVGCKNNPAWFRKHQPGFYARLAEHMDRASDTMM